jgi:uncharacterized protein (DUF58 family)
VTQRNRSWQREQIRKLRLTARRLIHTFGEGSFRTLFYGRGIEFATLREYVPGDDIRQIEWNTTARRGTPFVKTFVEERDLSILLAVDVSSSMDVKREAMLQLASLITMLAATHDDRIGAMGFTNEVEFYVPPQKNPTQPDRILHLLLSQRGQKRTTSISNALSFLQRVLKKRSILFIISDFLDTKFESRILQLSQKHEIVGIFLYDPAEAGSLSPALIETADPETGRHSLVDGYDTKTLRAQSNFFQKQKQMVARTFGRARSDFLMFPAGEDPGLRMIDFLRRRQTARAPIQLVI